MKELIAKYAPVSVLGMLSAFGLGLADMPSGMPAGPRCDAPQEASQKQMTEDERVYYIGCGGLY